jgi:LEA14-like dessication related protein
VDNIEVSTIASSRIKLAAKANFHNPNKYDIILKKADIDVFFNDNFITNYSKEYNLKIEKNSDFTVPVEVELSLKDLDLNMISSAVNVFLGKKPEIEYDGAIKVKAYGLGIRVPVKGKSKLDIKF